MYCIPLLYFVHLSKMMEKLLQINNAGMAGHPRREVTSDGLELTMATNHYGHFLLTNLLLSKLILLCCVYLCHLDTGFQLGLGSHLTGSDILRKAMRLVMIIT